MTIKPCNHCGECCRASLCFFGQHLQKETPCSFIEEREGKTFCKLFALCKDTHYENVLNILLASGQGCCSKPSEEQLMLAPANLNIAVYFMRRYLEEVHGITMPD